MNKITTLAELLDHTSKNVWAGKKSEVQLVMNGRDVLRVLGNVKLNKITGYHVEALRSELKRASRSSGTVNRKLAALSKMLNVAYDIGAIDSVPRIRREREAEPRSYVLPPDDQVRFLSALTAIGGMREAGLCEFLLLSGLRVSEAFNLRREDIDWYSKSVRVASTKANRPRTVPLPDRALSLLAMDPELSMPWAGIQYQTLYLHFRQARKQVGLDHTGMVLHSLRHTYASRLVKAGANLRAVQQLLGHSSIVVTQRYAHLDLEDLTNAVSKLNTA